MFFRFANDAQWENPERECTLEENAALVSLYVEAAHVFREEDLAKSAVRVLQFMLDKLRDPATGAFYGGDSLLQKSTTACLQPSGTPSMKHALTP